MVDESRPIRAEVRGGSAPRWMWRTLRGPNPASLRGREHRVVRWIGAGRRNRAAAARQADPNVIDLARVRAEGDRVPDLGPRPAGGTVVNLPPITRRA